VSHIETALLDIRGLDALSVRDSPLRRIDPRAKTLTALAFIVAVVSFGKYEIAGLIPLVVYPIALMAVDGLPPRIVLSKVLLALPFVALIGAFNPVFDRAAMVRIGPLDISGGWISFASILLKSLLTLSAAVILIATTGFSAVCVALDRLRVPRVFVVQLLLLYRYLFVLAEEAARMLRAWSLRSAGRRRLPLGAFGPFAGQLLLRSMDRADRIHAAMLSRGFDGRMRTDRVLRFRAVDAVFVLAWVALFVAARLYNAPRALGEAVMRSLP